MESLSAFLLPYCHLLSGALCLAVSTFLISPLPTVIANQTAVKKKGRLDSQTLEWLILVTILSLEDQQATALLLAC